jgi:imidazolonepropionase-like amidohydrolase
MRDAEILDAWTRVCAEATLPDRRVGLIAPGYEASFVAFDGNPLEDWSAIDRITYRFKDGAELMLRESPAN